MQSGIVKKEKINHKITNSGSGVCLARLRLQVMGEIRSLDVEGRRDGRARQCPS